MRPSLLFGALTALCAFLTSCETVSQGSAERAAMLQTIQNEPPGNYFIGRRYYKKDYKMWGWIREPRKPWNTAQFVMLNEQQRLAPDRQQGKLGTDNNYEYRVRGRYSGGVVYEPASNRFYPEFVLSGYELVSTSPPMIYKDRRQLDPSVRILTPPY